MTPRHPNPQAGAPLRPRFRFLAITLAMLAPAAASAAGGLLQPARVADDGSVIWARGAPAVPPPIAERVARAQSTEDSVRAWTVLAEDPDLRPSALIRLATWAQQSGYVAVAESMWTELARTPGPWQWEALRGRTDMLTGRPASADSMLASVIPSGWTPLEEAAWLYRRARIKLALADTTAAEVLARRVLHEYPATPLALRALADLEAWSAARGTTLPAVDELEAAEAEALAGDKRAAIRRIASVEHRLDAESRWSATLRRASLLRELRNYDSALAAATEAEHGVTEDHRRAAISLERARIHRDAGAPERALRAYERASTLAADPLLADTADAEALRVAEFNGLGDEVVKSAARLAERGGAGAGPAAARLGVEHLRNGNVERARDWFVRSGVEGGAFWASVLDSSSGRSDSLLRQIAGRPGFDFYRVAARESLKTFEWPRVVAAPAQRPHPSIRHAEHLVAVGATDEALRMLERWRVGANGTAPAGGALRPPHESPGAPDLLQVPSWSAQPIDAAEPRWRQLLAAASVSFGAGAWGTGIRYARLAFDEVPPDDALARWSVVPWMYPPAHAQLFAPEGAWTDSTALLYAVTWQESRFDSLARSTSNALGLMQLKLATAREQARMMRLPLPHERDLFRPSRNVRLGAGYLDRIAGYFDQRVTMALAAYNAGPTGAKPWSNLPDPGGEALACELITIGQTHHYVKTVLGAWQAARSLRPRFE